MSIYRDLGFLSSLSKQTQSPLVSNVSRTSALAQKSALGNVLEGASYEVLPFKNTFDQVVEHVPLTVPLTITTTATKGLQATVDLATALRRVGYKVAPHIAARQLADRTQLLEVTDQLREAGIDRVFVIGGDLPEPKGNFHEAMHVLDTLAEEGIRYASVGVGGYPEGHGLVPDDQIETALRRKAAYATEVITQLCFDADVLTRWESRLRVQGICTPIRVGIPGKVSRQKLMRVSAGLGLGQSARFLTKQRGLITRFFMPGGYSPDRLIKAMAPVIADDATRFKGVHIYTFNEVEATERWRREWLDRLS